MCIVARKFRSLVIFLTILLVAGMYLTPTASAAEIDRGMLYAQSKATIKTQKAADSIKNGVRGIDVSKWQGTIDWSKVAQDNVKFVLCRATYGTKPDSTFLRNARGAHENGLLVGAYHYARFTSQKTMEAEASAFLKQLKQVNITYPVVLDIEQKPAKMTNAKLTDLANQFADIIKAQGYNVMIYSYNNFFRDHLNTRDLKHDLWVANYLVEPKFNQKLWQHTSQGRVSGIKGDVDINIAYGNLATKKKVVVNKTISESIKKTLVSRYRVTVPAQGVDSSIYTAIRIGLQKEINKQWDVNLPVDGKLSREALELLSEVRFTSATKGNITYLIQAELFYRGYYKEAPTARFDSKTQEALAAYQKAKGLAANGEMTEDTLYILLG